MSIINIDGQEVDLAALSSRQLLDLVYGKCVEIEDLEVLRDSVSSAISDARLVVSAASTEANARFSGQVFIEGTTVFHVTSDGVEISEATIL